jgi:hypothetical protein
MVGQDAVVVDRAVWRRWMLMKMVVCLQDARGHLGSALPVLADRRLVEAGRHLGELLSELNQKS